MNAYGLGRLSYFPAAGARNLAKPNLKGNSDAAKIEVLLEDIRDLLAGKSKKSESTQSAGSLCLMADYDMPAVFPSRLQSLHQLSPGPMGKTPNSKSRRLQDGGPQRCRRPFPVAGHRISSGELQQTMWQLAQNVVGLRGPLIRVVTLLWTGDRPFPSRLLLWLTTGGTTPCIQ